MINKVKASILAIGIACTALFTPLSAMAKAPIEAIVIVICDDSACVVVVIGTD